MKPKSRIFMTFILILLAFTLSLIVQIAIGAGA